MAVNVRVVYRENAFLQVLSVLIKTPEPDGIPSGSGVVGTCRGTKYPGFLPQEHGSG